MGHSGDTRFGMSAGATTCVRAAVGCLVEVRVGLLATLADVERLNDAVVRAVRRISPAAVICADYRRATPVTREVANLWSAAMRRVNRHIARSGVLLDPSNTLFNLQVARVIRCAGSERRRLFENEQELRRWLDEALTDLEREALRTMFSEVHSYGIGWCTNQSHNASLAIKSMDRTP